MSVVLAPAARHVRRVMQTTRKKLSDAHQTQIRQLIEQDGHAPTARRLGVSPQTIATLAAGLVVHVAIAEFVERQLVALGEEVP